MRNRFIYTPEHVEFLKSGYMSMNIRDLAVSFNKKFKLKKTDHAIRSALKNRKIICGRKGAACLKKRTKLITLEQEKFIRDTYKNISAASMTELFNVRFTSSKTVQQIKSFVHNHRINSGRTGNFPKGHKPWNTGTKGLVKTNSGNFKKGSIPKNLKPLGHERICKKDGFILMKVAEKNPYTGAGTRYKHKQVHVYEQTYGPILEGMVVVFKDGIKTNCEPDNLMLASRAELLRLNKRGYKDAPADLKPTILALSKLEVKTFSKEKDLNEIKK